MTGVDWPRLVLAVIGGDEREREIARLAAATGAEVRAYGFPLDEASIRGVMCATNAREAAKGADYALFPIPGISADGSLYAPEVAEPIIPDAALLAALAPGAHVILGRADRRLQVAAGAAGVKLHEYESDQELMLLRAPAIVEGALRGAIENTDVTLHDADVLVVGFGNIGSALASALVSLGARVRVAARNPVQRAAAFVAGAIPVTLDDLPQVARDVAMVFSTVPAPVIDRPVLQRLPRGALVMDLAAPPGGVDLATAKDLGHTGVWARGLGRRAPVTVGRSQWTGIRRLIESVEGEAG